MDCFSLKHNKKEYSKAFQYYRKEWIEANIGWILAVLIVAVVAWISVAVVKKIRKELADL